MQRIESMAWWIIFRIQDPNQRIIACEVYLLRSFCVSAAVFYGYGFVDEVGEFCYGYVDSYLISRHYPLPRTG